MLQLNGDWRLRADNMSWMLEYRYVSAESGAETWKIKGYYPLLEDALRGACNHLMKPSKDITDLLRRIDDLHKMIRAATAGISVSTSEIGEDDFLD